MPVLVTWNQQWAAGHTLDLCELLSWCKLQLGIAIVHFNGVVHI